ncbi:Putative disease resistance protein RGA4 [Dendrobium catenatum]|uniref:Disease resistance protein RGA4 n=1 Tax=Dendrobium catenatum TaxID=906689 RepID=A0A2I0WA34_9ASPA|nr:Putative disease resistance protein RGA4 [Dendrobium catenatum]
MADMSLDPIMEKIISFCFRYVEDQVRWKKRTKEELQRLREKYPKIQAVVHFASSQEQITDKNPALNEWLWQLQDAIDDADDVVDDLEYMELEKQLTKNKKLRRVRSIMKSMKKKLVKIGNRVIKRDPNLKRLEEAVQKLDEVSADVTNFLHLLDSAKQEQKEQEGLGSALTEIFKASRCLRLLYIRADEFQGIPEKIRYLKHLRYLKIEGVKSYHFTRLPRSLSNLYHLLYIIHGRSWGLNYPKDGDFLPCDINNLSNLRYLEFPGTFISSICGIGKLMSLQELNRFDIRDVSGYRIGELENMNDLCKLGINCLENVKNAEEACSAKLCEKRRLTKLTLCWSSGVTHSRNNDLDENVLNNLQPPKCLRNLSIDSYTGARSAKWMNNVNSIFNLEKIELKFCSQWETFPSFGQLPFLKSLTLSGMPKVKWLESKFNGNDKYRAFPLLEVLHIWGLEALEDWFEAGVAAEDGCLFPCLTDLVLYNCPKLKELPSLPSELKRLVIRRTGWTTLNFRSNSNPIPLKSLEVFHCPNITSLLLADEIARLAALRKLKIQKCPSLIFLGEMQTSNNCHLMLSHLSISDPSVLLMEPLRSIASFKMLSIEDNDELVSFPNEAEQWFLNDRTSLSELQFCNLKSLETLPSSLESLSSLQSLYIEHVPMLRELPNLPPSLQRLSIIGECHPELKERYREDGGSDWQNIAHIPDISIRPE